MLKLEDKVLDHVTEGDVLTLDERDAPPLPDKCEMCASNLVEDDGTSKRDVCSRCAAAADAARVRQDGAPRCEIAECVGYAAVHCAACDVNFCAQCKAAHTRMYASQIAEEKHRTDVPATRGPALRCRDHHRRATRVCLTPQCVSAELGILLCEQCVQPPGGAHHAHTHVGVAPVESAERAVAVASMERAEALEEQLVADLRSAAAAARKLQRDAGTVREAIEAARAAAHAEVDAHAAALLALVEADVAAREVALGAREAAARTGLVLAQEAQRAAALAREPATDAGPRREAALRAEMLVERAKVDAAAASVGSLDNGGLHVEVMRVLPGRLAKRVVELPYNGVSFDEGGVLWWIGTTGKTRPYENPHRSGAVLARMSSTFVAKDGRVLGDAAHFVQHCPNPAVCNSTKQEAGSWMAVDFGMEWRVEPTHYCLRADISVIFTTRERCHPIHWELQASTDGKVWVALRRHGGDKALEKADATVAWEVEARGHGYRAFRVMQTGLNNAGVESLCCSGIELYGRLWRV